MNILSAEEWSKFSSTHVHPFGGYGFKDRDKYSVSSRISQKSRENQIEDEKPGSNVNGCFKHTARWAKGAKSIPHKC